MGSRGRRCGGERTGERGSGASRLHSGHRSRHSSGPARVSAASPQDHNRDDASSRALQVPKRLSSLSLVTWLSPHSVRSCRRLHFTDRKAEAQRSEASASAQGHTVSQKTQGRVGTEVPNRVALFPMLPCVPWFSGPQRKRVTSFWLTPTSSTASSWGHVMGWKTG